MEGDSLNNLVRPQSIGRDLDKKTQFLDFCELSKLST